jgi:amino acid transporter
MATVYLFFYRAMKAQKFNRDGLPYKGWFQPYCAWYGLICMSAVVCCYGYAIYLPGSFTVGNFFIYYLMLFVVLILCVGWKLIKRTKLIPALEVDLIWEAPAIDAYEATLLDDDNGLWDSLKTWLKHKKEHHSA